MPQEITTKRLFAAVSVPLELPNYSTLWSLNENSIGVDKMETPTNYYDIIKLCRFFYEHDGIAYNTVNKHIELGINGYNITQGTCKDNEYLVYKYLNNSIEAFLRNAALEFLISGLVIPEATWGIVGGTEIYPNLRKNYVLPTDLWYRDPLSVTLRKTPLPNKLSVSVKLSGDDISFIQNKGKFSDGTDDKELYELLKKAYPEFVKAVEANKTEFKLVDPLVIRRYARSGSPYPTPYLLPALELFMHKRNLRKMDYSIAARVISAIMHIKIGSDDFPLTEDDADVVEAIKSQMTWRGLANNVERVFQLYTNHTVEMSWIMPDVAAMLDEGKYRAINDDILLTLGIPRIIVAGEASRSGSSNSEFAMLPPVGTIDMMRQQLLEFPRKLYKEIRERNGFRGVPEPEYPPIRLQSLSTLIEMGQILHDVGALSKTTLDELANINYEAEQQRRAKEAKLGEELGLTERPDVPYSPKPQSPKVSEDVNE